MSIPRTLLCLGLAAMALQACGSPDAEQAAPLPAGSTEPKFAEPAVGSTEPQAGATEAAPAELPGAAASATPLAGGTSMPLQLTSPAFTAGGPIPARYSCDGEDISPELRWTDPPAGTASFALIFDDPDAPRGTWVHWVLFNIPAEVRGLAEGVPGDVELADGARHGENDFGGPGYGGPCPPGGTHRYFFKLYALDQVLDLAALATKAELEAAMQGHLLAQAELMGTYSR
jgi:Raf kinase inhibitor-like YbhB/YbcL family protein